MLPDKSQSQPPINKSAGIYIHIPFCKQACVYCNFHFSTSLKHKEELLDALHKELIINKNYLSGAGISTIYLGGGTPSLLSADEISRLFDTIFRNYPISELQECTLEANPDDLTLPYLKMLKQTPVNRLSIGIQSFRDEDLTYMKRAHSASQADYAVKAAQDAGFENLSVDLIYGTPGMDDKAWKQNMQTVRSLGVPHFSAYALTVEERTALHHAIKQHKSRPVDPEQAAQQFEQLMEFAAVNGYDHYEISNFARPGQYAMHNTNYWLGVPYLGIGPSAHSFDGETRRWNIANNALYIKGIAERKPAREEETLTPTQQVNEYIMTSLRTMWGCDLDKIAQHWGSQVATMVEKSSHLFQEKNWVTQQGRKLMLTNAGKLFADRIAAELFIEEWRREDFNSPSTDTHDLSRVR